MTALKEWYDLIGKYRGESTLWIEPSDPGLNCPSRAWVGCLSQEKFSELRYNWSYEGDPQQGRLILGRPGGGETVRAVWFDTWHMQDQFMVCEGAVDKEGVLNLHGTYEAPPGPDWGWQISIQAQGSDAFLLQMYNHAPAGLPGVAPADLTGIAPGGTKALAVEALYQRKLR